MRKIQALIANIAKRITKKSKGKIWSIQENIARKGTHNKYKVKIRSMESTVHQIQTHMN